MTALVTANRILSDISTRRPRAGGDLTQLPVETALAAVRHARLVLWDKVSWTPACAGVTKGGGVGGRLTKVYLAQPTLSRKHRRPRPGGDPTQLSVETALAGVRHARLALWSEVSRPPACAGVTGKGAAATGRRDGGWPSDGQPYCPSGSSAGPLSTTCGSGLRGGRPPRQRRSSSAVSELPGRRRVPPPGKVALPP